MSGAERGVPTSHAEVSAPSTEVSSQAPASIQVPHGLKPTSTGLYPRPPGMPAMMPQPSGTSLGLLPPGTSCAAEGEESLKRADAALFNATFAKEHPTQMDADLVDEDCQALAARDTRHLPVHLRTGVEWEGRLDAGVERTKGITLLDVLETKTVEASTA